MDPFTLAIAAVGIGISIFGGIKSSQTASQVSAVSQDEAAQEKLENDQRAQQMELQANRQQTENIRNVQKARAMNIATSTSGNSQFGSGLAGAEGADTAMGGYNALGINQNLQIGRTLYGLSNKISADKIQLAKLGGNAATDQGISNIGGDISKSAGPLGSMAKGLGGGGSPSSGLSGGAAPFSMGDATGIGGLY